MFSVLLVDDENWVLESLNASIEWKDYGFHVIGMATNGLEAFQIIQKQKPDLVITDIRMPGMNGLELIKKTKDIMSNVQFVVASGYAEFAYAQKAISYGAVGYTLKPFDEAEIINCLQKVRQTIKKEIITTEIELTRLFESIDTCDENSVKDVLESCQIDIARDEPVIIASFGKGKICFPENVKFLSIKIGCMGEQLTKSTTSLGDMKWAYIVVNAMPDTERYLEEQLCEHIKGIAIGKRVKSICELPEAIEEAITFAYGFFMTGSRHLYKNTCSNYVEIKNILNYLEDALKNKDLQVIDTCFEEFETLLKSGRFTIKHAYYLYNVAMSFIYNLIEPHETYIDHYGMLLKMFDNVSQMLQHIKSTMRIHISTNTNAVTANLANKTINDILQYVNDNFYKSISIQNISQKFYVNPNYVSQLFKKEVGYNFIDYLVKLRIDFACKLLRESGFNIQIISEKTGYNDYFYFARAFKKITGKTPSEYRNEL